MSAISLAEVLQFGIDILLILMGKDDIDIDEDNENDNSDEVNTNEGSDMDKCDVQGLDEAVPGTSNITVTQGSVTMDVNRDNKEQLSLGEVSHPYLLHFLYLEIKIQNQAQCHCHPHA